MDGFVGSEGEAGGQLVGDQGVPPDRSLALVGGHDLVGQQVARLGGAVRMGEVDHLLVQFGRRRDVGSGVHGDVVDKVAGQIGAVGLLGKVQLGLTHSLGVHDEVVGAVGVLDRVATVICAQVGAHDAAIAVGEGEGA